MQLDFRQYDLKHVKGRDNMYELFEIDAATYVDFDIKRIYYLTDIGGPTGQHCHYIEKELFVMATGSCTAIIDRGYGKEEIPMNQGQAIYCGDHVWHGFKDFSTNAILLAVSSTKHNPDRSDYLEDYDEYQRLISEKGFTPSHKNE
jgi:mannose-6-phosphate isomerase-like protein (cupin superfamily)